MPKTRGVTVSWIARALSGSRFSLTDSTTDPDRNGSFAEPLPAGDYAGTGRNPYAATADRERNGATGPGFVQLDLRLGYRLRSGNSRTLDLFADIFNATNRANFDNPIGDRRSTDFLNVTVLRAGAVPTTRICGSRDNSRDSSCRTTAESSTINTFTMPAGALAMGWVIETTSPRIPFVLGGAAALACSVALVASAQRQRQRITVASRQVTELPRRGAVL